MTATAFRVSRNYVNFTNLNAMSYVLLPWETEVFDTNDTFTDNTWMPVVSGENKVVSFGGQVWIYMNATGNPPNYVAKIWKNGQQTEIIAGIGVAGSFPNSFVISFAGHDLADPGDKYQLYVYATNSNAIVEGHPAHTWWSGAVIE